MSKHSLILRHPAALFLGAVLALAACAASTPPVPRAPTSEAELRRRLGIPEAAHTVLILNQSSHLDLDWLLTFEEYYRTLVREVLYASLAFVERDPLHHYAVAEMGFVRRWWEELSPQNRNRLRAAIASGRWQIVGGGVSSPDEVLPGGEALVRDWGHGNRWATEILGTRAQLAWDPDSFGHSPATPTILRHLSLEGVAFARIPGDPFAPNAEQAALKEVLFGTGHDLSGSIAERWRRTGTQAFRWAGLDGAEVLGLWLPRTYCQGDDIDTVLSFYNFPPASDASAVVDSMARIQGYLEELAPFAWTGYLFVPIGCDFTAPKQRLAAIVRRWNTHYYPRTGVWVHLGTFQTYAALIRYHWEKLPRERADLTPVWTGFYATRPAIKHLHRRLTALLQDVEALMALSGNVARDPELERLWWLVGFGNHHDWIPGTAPDRVYVGEQLAEFAAGVAAARELLEQHWRGFAGDATGGTWLLVGAPAPAALAPVAATLTELPPGTRGVELVVDDRRVPAWCTPHLTHLDGSWASAKCLSWPEGLTGPALLPAAWRPMAMATTTTPSLVLGAEAVTVTSSASTWSWHWATDGWRLASWRVAGQELLAEAVAPITLVADDGGLYRLGAETSRCGWDPYPAPPTTLAWRWERDGSGVRLWERRRWGAASIELTWWHRPDGRLAVSTVVQLPEGTTAILRLVTRDAGTTITTAVPYGVAERPRRHLFDPSFWPAVGWIDTGSLAAFSAAFAAWGLTADGELRTIVGRNTTPSERCEPLGAAGTDPGPIAGEVLLWPHPGRNWRAAGVAALGTAVGRPPRLLRGPREGGPLRLRATGDFLIVATEPLGGRLGLRLWSPTGGGGGEIASEGITWPWKRASAHFAYGVTDPATRLEPTATTLRFEHPYALVSLEVPNP